MIGKILLTVLVALWVWVVNEWRNAPLVADSEGFNPNDKHDFVD